MLPFQLLPTRLPRCPSQPLPSPCIPLFPARSSFTACIPCRRGSSLYLFLFFSYPFLSASLHSLFVPFFPLVIAACTLFLPWLLPAKKKKKNERGAVVGSEPSGMGLHEVSRSFSPPSPGSNIQSWHQCTGSGHPGDVPVRDLSPPPTGDAAGRLPAAHRSWSWSN